MLASQTQHIQHLERDVKKMKRLAKYLIDRMPFSTKQAIECRYPNLRKYVHTIRFFDIIPEVVEEIIFSYLGK